MYSQKVMEHFREPKNMGEIKDADGVGKVGNPVCLLPDEKIHSNPACKEISKSKKDERIFTHNGSYENILGNYPRRYKGNIIRLKNNLGTINLTPEHLVYAMKVPAGDNFLRNKGKKTLIPSWYHAENLKKGDIVLYPVLKEEKDIKFLDINIPKARYDFKSKKIPKKVPLDSDLLRLFGYFLAEGNIQNKPSKTYISFTLNIGEKDIYEDIKSISNSIFDIDAKIKERPDRKTVSVYLYNARLARWFKGLFGNGAEHKKIPHFIMHLPLEKQKSLIYGLWKGDGYVNIDRKGKRAGYATSSYQLAQQIKVLLLRQNIAPSIYIDKERNIKGVNHKKAYRIHIGQRDSLKKLCHILKIDYDPKTKESVTSWFSRGFLYTPITSKNIFNYGGMVHNLEVDNAHSFVSEGFCLHNCGDLMFIYIKVGKNDKGEEIIEDIKFKTFGCGAAIATSSMTTELAKGKTLDECLKITRDNVKDALDGLPTIKLHCSNLAVDGLHKAIEDYRKKSI